MNEPRESRDPQKSFFRRIAVERYEGPLEMDTPELLTRNRPWLPVAALGVLAVAAFAAWWIR